MKRNLLVTLADRNYLDQAKQLFSSVYFNAGWKGDYMLLAHEIPEEELRWFRDKGILVKRCKPLYKGKIGKFEHPPAVLSKFYLFTMEFKKWKNVIFLDADIIVRASLDELTRIRGFAAYFATCGPFRNRKLIYQFTNKSHRGIWDRFEKEYGLKAYSFNTGVMAFSTDIIKNDSLSELKRLFDLYGKISCYGEEGIINLFLYKRWTKLPQIYNNYLMLYSNIIPQKIDGIVLHFVGEHIRPWISKNFYYKEWEHNLERAEFIDLNKIPPPRKKWTKLEIRMYPLLLISRIAYFVIWDLCLKEILYSIDRVVGLVGVFLKRHRPRLYFKIKWVKRRFGLR